MPVPERFVFIAFVLTQNLSDRAFIARRSRRSLPAEIASERWREIF
jgi:hypothetical protein